MGKNDENHCGRWLDPRGLSRRQMLQLSGAGFGSVALAGLLGSEAQAGQGTLRGPHFAPVRTVWASSQRIASRDGEGGGRALCRAFHALR